MAAERSDSEVRMGRHGEIVVPAELVAELGFSEGSRLVCRVEDGELRITTFRARLERARGIVRDHVPDGVSLVDELLAERRADAASD